MNLNQFTIKSQEAIQEAFQIASASGRQAVEPGHLLKGVIQIDESLTDFLFRKSGIGKISPILDKIIESYPRVSGAEPIKEPKNWVMVLDINTPMITKIIM